jgi:hypothetical protein
LQACGSSGVQATAHVLEHLLGPPTAATATTSAGFTVATAAAAAACLQGFRFDQYMCRSSHGELLQAAKQLLLLQYVQE